MPRPLLNTEELEILTILWDEGPLKPTELQQRLTFPIKNSALRWQLGEMLRDGYVTRAPCGKAYLYRAAQPRRAVFGSFARRLKQMLFGGSALAMVGELVETGQLSAEDLKALTKIATTAKPAPASPKKKP